MLVVQRSLHILVEVRVWLVEFPTESVLFGQYRSVFFGIYKYYTGDKIGQYIVLYVTTIKYVI